MSLNFVCIMKSGKMTQFVPSIRGQGVEQDCAVQCSNPGASY